MRTPKRQTVTVVAGLCTAGVLAIGAPLAARGPKPAHPGPQYGVKPSKPAKPTKPSKFVKPPKATFLVTLLGRNEVSLEGRRRAGDLDGQGGGAVTATALGKLCFGVVVQGITTPVAMHIHRGLPGRNGPIVVPLAAPSSGDPGASAGCVDVAGDLLSQIRRHPNRFYLNVHSGDFPNGALRGQLHRAPRRT
jgi:hypothetical protein